MKCGCKRLLKAVDAYIAKADDDLVDALTEAGFLDAEGTVSEASTLEERVAAALTAETDYILDGIKEAADLEEFAKTVWPKLKKGDTCAKDLFDIFLEELEAFLPTLVSGYIVQIDADLLLGQMSKRTSEWAKSWSGQLADIMQLDSHTTIENLLTTALEEGQSVADFTLAIQESGIREEYYRARRTAITELLRAHSAASQEAIMQAPAVEEKVWVHTGSYRTTPRQNHVEMNSQRVGKSEKFTLKGADGKTYTPMYPRDPDLPPGESVNCHCITQSIVNEDVLGLPIEERRRLQEEAIAEMDDEWEAELDRKNREAAGL